MTCRRQVNRFQVAIPLDAASPLVHLLIGWLVIVVELQFCPIWSGVVLFALATVEVAWTITIVDRVQRLYDHKVSIHEKHTSIRERLLHVRHLIQIVASAVRAH